MLTKGHADSIILNVHDIINVADRAERLMNIDNFIV